MNFVRFTLARYAALVAVLAAFLIGGILFMAAPFFLLTEADAVEAARVHGFTEAQVRDVDRFFVDWSGCSSDDVAAFHLTAINPNDEQVDITVCMGWPFKGATVRVQ